MIIYKVYLAGYILYIFRYIGAHVSNVLQNCHYMFLSSQAFLRGT
jgi:hypothetical protein